MWGMLPPSQSGEGNLSKVRIRGVSQGTPCPDQVPSQDSEDGEGGRVTATGTAQHVLVTWLEVCLLRSRMRTFLYLFFLNLHFL